MTTHCPVVGSYRSSVWFGLRAGSGLRSAIGTGMWPDNEKNSSSRPSASFIRVGWGMLIGSHLGRYARVKSRQTCIPQKRGWARVFGRATALYERAQNWAIGSDPGLLRLRMAARTTASLAVALLILFLLTKVTHQPLTVALLGVLITMVAGRAVNEPEPSKQKITMALLSLPAALAITAATLLAPHRLLADVVFVGGVFGAGY